MAKTDIPEGLRMGRFLAVGKLGFNGGRSDLRAAAGGPFELDAVGVVP